MRCLLALTLAFVTLALPAAADPPAPLPHPSNLRSDILYTHKGEFVRVSPIRALTLNAHIEQFAYDPLGIEIAVAGSETSGETTTHFVKTLDARTGHEISRYALAAPTDDKSTSLSLLGFSTSGKYVLLKQLQPDPNEPGTARAEFLRWDLSVSPPTLLVIRPEAALPANGEPDEDGFLAGYASPDGRWIAFRQNYRVPGSDGKPGRLQTLYSLYDPEHDTFRPLALPPGAGVYSWRDALNLQIWEGGKAKQFDVMSGQVTPLTTLSESAAPASKQYPDLTLDTQRPEQYDGHTAQESEGHLRSYIIWIRRTPFSGFPLDVAAAGLMPDYLGSGPDGDPQAVWSPTGKQIAFLANKDLCVTDLSVASGPLPNEKLAVGVKLSCADEQALAVSNLKQVGLALIQYTQDNDEKYPAADGWIKTIMPFAHTADIFQVDGHAVVYMQPPGISLASVEVPAETENAFVDLPCARVVLFCDGHVKVFPK